MKKNIATHINTHTIIKIQKYKEQQCIAIHNDCYFFCKLMCVDTDMCWRMILQCDVSNKNSNLVQTCPEKKLKQKQNEQYKIEIVS